MSDFNQPLSGNEMPRFGGIATMFRLPAPRTPDGIDVGIVGVPLEPAMRMLLGRDDQEMGRRIAEAYREAFFARRAMPDHDEPLFEGVLETLDALAARGAVMGVATGKTMRGLVARMISMIGRRWAGSAPM